MLLANLFAGADARCSRPREEARGGPLPESGTRGPRRQVAPGVGADTQDARAVLRASARALRLVRAVSYRARYGGEGAFATGSPSAEGEARLSKLRAGDPLKAKLAARGLFTPAGDYRAQPFHTAFDGRAIRRLSPKDRSLTEKALAETDPGERSLSFVTSFFGGGPYDLLMFEYVADEPLASQLKAPVVDYEGRAAVAGVLCHVVYVEYDLSPKRRVKQRWFIGTKDGLPRKLEEVGADDKGRPGAYVLELSGLLVNPPEGANAFVVPLPRGYSVKPYVAPRRPALLAVGETAPDWKLADAEGRSHELSEYRGKLVVLDFWATWCVPCLRAMPEMQRLHEKYRGRNVLILGVNSWEQSNPAAYMRGKGYDYGLLLRGEQIAGAYRVTLLPTVYVIGADGKIIYASTGTADGLEPLIEKYSGGAPK